MRLFESIVEANHKALAGDPNAGIRRSEFAHALPVVALTCFDPRMHPVMPEVLGIAEPDFIWITNAGNVVSTPLSSTARSIGLACVLHGAREIAVIGHQDCLVFGALRAGGASSRTAFDRLGSALPEALLDFLERLADERRNVEMSVRSLRASPFVPRSVPIHGLVVNHDSGRLDWVLSGYGAGGLEESRQQPLPPPGAITVETDPLDRPLPPIGVDHPGFPTPAGTGL